MCTQSRRFSSIAIVVASADRNITDPPRHPQPALPPPALCQATRCDPQGYSGRFRSSAAGGQPRQLLAEDPSANPSPFPSRETNMRPNVAALTPHNTHASSNNVTRGFSFLPLRRNQVVVVSPISPVRCLGSCMQSITLRTRADLPFW